MFSKCTTFHVHNTYTIGLICVKICVSTKCGQCGKFRGHYGPGDDVLNGSCCYSCGWEQNRVVNKYDRISMWIQLKIELIPRFGLRYDRRLDREPELVSVRLRTLQQIFNFHRFTDIDQHTRILWYIHNITYCRLIIIILLLKPTLFQDFPRGRSVKRSNRRRERVREQRGEYTCRGGGLIIIIIEFMWWCIECFSKSWHHHESADDDEHKHETCEYGASQSFHLPYKETKEL